MLSAAIWKSLKDRVTMSSFGDHIPLRLSKTDMKFTSGFLFANAYVIVEHILVTG